MLGKTEAQTRRNTLFKLLGDLPSWTQDLDARTTQEIEHPTYLQRDILLDNHYDSYIPMTLLTPRHIKPPYPAVLYLHAHGHRYDIGKQEIFEPKPAGFTPADDLIRTGYAVLCADAYAFGERQNPDEMTHFKQFLWEGKTLWGMMLRDDLLTLDYLYTHPEIDANRIAAVGMSMGSTRAWWLAALDQRIAVTVAVACLTRYQDLIEAKGHDAHSIYFYVPGMLKYFDTENILSLIAPRPLLALTGDQDPTTPLSGIRKLETHLNGVYHEYPGNFRSVVYPGIGHAFTIQMWKALQNWLATHLSSHHESNDEG